MVWIVLCRTGCDFTRWLCDGCIPKVRARGVEVMVQEELTTGFPCDECGGQGS